MSAEVCSFCGQRTEYLIDGDGPLWRHVDATHAHEWVLCTPRREGEPRVELALDELGEPRPSLMLARDAGGKVVASAAQLPGSPLWIAYHTDGERFMTDLTATSAYEYLLIWAREGTAK